MGAVGVILLHERGEQLKKKTGDQQGETNSGNLRTRQAPDQQEYSDYEHTKAKQIDPCRPRHSFRY